MSALGAGLSAARRTTLICAVAGALLAASAGSAVGAPDIRSSTLPKINSITAASGPSTGGTRVTVRGSNLSHVAAVTFGGIRGTSIQVAASHTSLRVTAPAHAIGAVDVRVRTAAGWSAISSHDAFAYQAYSAVAAGGEHSCAASSGAVRCWGLNRYGQLGNGTTTDSTTPVAVSGLSRVVALSAGRYHTCALISDGTVRCWGYNVNGQLGNNTTTDEHSPAKVHDLSHVVEISAGFDQTCAVISDGTARCWGDNADGDLGNNRITQANTPVKVHGLSHATWIAANAEFGCALRSSGTVMCWGRNFYGQLGNGTTTDARTPVQVIGVAHATALSVSYVSACAVVSGGAVRCWGYGGDGELGNGATTNSHTATSVDGLSGVGALSGGGNFSCAVVRSHVFCWGDNVQGDIGANSTAAPLLTPTAVARLGAINALSTGAYHSVVQLTSGGLRAWGANESGQLGNGTTTDSPLPVPVTG